VAASIGLGQNAPVRVPPMPMDLRWLSEPEAFEHSQGTLRIVAGPGTDWFTDPGGRPPSLNAPALAGPQEGPFRLAARVTVAFGATFGAGGLVVFANVRLWPSSAWSGRRRTRPRSCRS